MALTDAQIPDALANAWNKIISDGERMSKMRDYHRGKQMFPRPPANVDTTLFDLVKRSTMNLMRLAVNIPSQLSFIDGYSRVDSGVVERDPVEWGVWHKSGFKAQQTNVFRTSLIYGHSFVMVDPATGILRLLTTQNTTAFFADPVNDRVPIYAVTLQKWDAGRNVLVYMDDQHIVRVPYESNLLAWDKNLLYNNDVIVEKHSLGRCPVVRFTCELDDEGRAVGIVESLIPAQDRVNQTVFDLLVTQTYGSFGVRWATGVTGEAVLDENGQQRVDANGFPVYTPMEVSQNRVMMTDNPEARFGTLPATPLGGFIDALDSAVRAFAVLGNIPPHSLLGSMNNLSGETIEAAMGQTSRFTHMLKVSWGESVLALMELVRAAWGIPEPEGSKYQVRWREMSDASIAQTVDALGKAATMLGVPGEALWSRVPGVTDADLMHWRNMRDEQAEAQLFDSTDGANAAARESQQLGLFGVNSDSASV